MNESIVTLAALAPLLALAGALVNGLFGRALKEPLPGIIASLAVAGGFVLSLLAFFGLGGAEGSVRVSLGRYLTGGDLSVDLGFMIDPLAVTMMLVITGVGLLIHVYSIGYMHGDDGYSRYFAQLNLFVAAMLVLVMADSFPLMFVGWEGVGVCSYLLIGFWYRDRANPDAGRKAFIVNRVGDVGFLLAMFLTFQVFGTLDIQAVNAMAPSMLYGSALLTGIGLLYLVAAAGKSAQLPLQVWLPDAMAGPTPVSALIHAATMVTAGVYLIARTGAVFSMAPAAAANPELYAGPATLIALLLFVGAAGKSAQIPLYVWLPDAMAGPTPVSALIHAATMVTAGVYMVVRCNIFYVLSPGAMLTVAVVGGLTAIVAATIGLVQNDIKKVLAYSTVSQLGLMFLGAGAGAFVAAIFHVVTHAFFKACLFLGSGSVIHAAGGEQDMRKMGGLKRHMPITYWTFLAATLA
ncbi:MAG: proton-conducting transporter membrane subunit, partial [Trueperaceae bacterium]